VRRGSVRRGSLMGDLASSLLRRRNSQLPTNRSATLPPQHQHQPPPRATASDGERHIVVDSASLTASLPQHVPLPPPSTLLTDEQLAAERLRTAEERLNTMWRLRMGQAAGIEAEVAKLHAGETAKAVLLGWEREQQVIRDELEREKRERQRLATEAAARKAKEVELQWRRSIGAADDDIAAAAAATAAHNAAQGGAEGRPSGGVATAAAATSSTAPSISAPAPPSGRARPAGAVAATDRPMVRHAPAVHESVLSTGATSSRESRQLSDPTRGARRPLILQTTVEASAPGPAPTDEMSELSV
jgi:hypothetical protein